MDIGSSLEALDFGSLLRALDIGSSCEALEVGSSWSWISAAREVFGVWDKGDGEVDAEAQQLGSDCFFGFLKLGSQNMGFYFGVLPEPEGRLGTVQHHFIRAPVAVAEPRALPEAP